MELGNLGFITSVDTDTCMWHCILETIQGAKGSVCAVENEGLGGMSCSLFFPDLSKWLNLLGTAALSATEEF